MRKGSGDGKPPLHPRTGGGGAAHSGLFAGRVNGSGVSSTDETKGAEAAAVSKKVVSEWPYGVIDFTLPPFSECATELLNRQLTNYRRVKGGRELNGIMSSVAKFVKRLQHSKQMQFNLHDLLRSIYCNSSDYAKEKIGLAIIVKVFVEQYRKAVKRMTSSGAMGKHTVSALEPYYNLLRFYQEQTVVRDKEGCYGSVDFDSFRLYLESHADSEEHYHEMRMQWIAGNQQVRL